MQRFLCEQRIDSGVKSRVAFWMLGVSLEVCFCLKEIILPLFDLSSGDPIHGGIHEKLCMGRL